MKPIIRETANITVGPYGLACTRAIVGHPILGRLLITQGYGGDDTIHGGAVRWEHGAVVSLLPGDTLEGPLQPFNDYVTILDRALSNYDDQRDVHWWGPKATTAFAKGLGL